MFKKFTTLFLIAFVMFFNSKAQTTLVAGDIAFTGFNTESVAYGTQSGNDYFSIILLTDISAETQILFTDGCYTDATGYITTNALGGSYSEYYFIWKSTTAMTAGTQVYFWSTELSNGSLPHTANASAGSIIAGKSLGLTISGDQIFAMQGATVNSVLDRITEGTFIAAIQMNETTGTTTDANWDNGVAISTSNSELPNSLTNGVNAVRVYGASTSEVDNAALKCSVSLSGTAATVRAACNNVSNWDTDDTNPFPLPRTDCPVAPSISVHPSSPSICAGSNTSFSITASNATSYLWQVNTGSGFTNISNGAPYSNAGTATLNITSATTGMSGYTYRCIATGSTSPAATSNAGTLTVNAAPSVNTHPSNANICGGSNTGFSISASNATGHQWQVNTGSGFTNVSNGALYSNATTNTLTITGATTGMNGYTYRCIASGGCSPASTSNSASLTVNTPVTYYQDLDNDGYGNPSVTQSSCTAVGGYVTNSNDCNDGDNKSYKGAVPYNISVNNVTSFTADVTWNTGCATSWQTRRSPAGQNAWSCVIVNTNSRKLAQMEQGTDYEVQVRAIYGAGDTSAWSSSELFSTINNCQNASGLSTTNITATTAQVNWINQSDDGKRIHFREVGTNDWTTAVMNAGVAKRKVTGLKAGTSYEWQIRSSCSATELSSWSVTKTFTTLSTREEQLLLANSSVLSVYPNPGRDIFNVETDFGAAETIQLTIFNMLGEQVISDRREVEAGSNNISLDLTGKANGVYFVKISSKEGTRIGKLVIK